MGIRSRSSEFEKTTLKINKELHKSILSQKTDLSNIKGIEKDIVKNQHLLEKSKKIIAGLENSTGKDAIENALEIIKLRKEATKAVEDQIKAAENGEEINEDILKTNLATIAAKDLALDMAIDQLSPLQQQLLYTQLQRDMVEEIVEEDKERLKKAKLLEQNLGSIGTVLGVLGKLTKDLPGSARLFSDAAAEAKAEMIEIEKTTGEVPSKLKGATIAVKHLGKGISNAFKSPTVIIGGIIKLLSELDSRLVKAQKTLNLNNAEVMEYHKGLEAAADASNNINVTSKSLNEAQMELTKNLGISNQFSNSMKEDFVVLTKQYKLSNEAAAGLTKQSILMGQGTKKTADNAALTGVNMLRAKGINVSFQKMLEQTSKVTGQVAANLNNNPEAIARAIAAATELGTTLEAVAEIGKSLLNFENSIANEMEAELLIGRELNLERARALALTGDQEELAAELLEQVGSYSEFNDMNVIQQQKLASAFGMSADQMADMLAQQEMLRRS